MYRPISKNMETRRSGKDAVRQTRSATPNPSPNLIIKASLVKRSPSPAGGLQKLKKKFRSQKLKEKLQESVEDPFKEPTLPDDKRRSLPPSPDLMAQGSKADEGGANRSPGIRTRLSTGSIHMNGTTTISTAKERAQQENILKQIEKDVTMSPATSIKKRNSTAGPGDTLVDHPPPKKRKIGRNDGSGEDNRNDYYCWLCHKEGTVVCCELCPRVYHIKCLELAGELPMDWVCPECEKIMVAECRDTRSKSMAMLTLDQLCTLLMYALERMGHEGSDPFQTPVDMALFPNYSDYVYNPMDIETLGKNIKKRLYGSTEAFTADTKWILHNCIIYNGAQNKLTASAKMIVKICKHEMNEIELCPDCYLNSCIRQNDEWFSELCRTPHTLVWAKLKGYPFWPAKALREEDGQVDVRFFGAHDRSWVPVSQCFLLSMNIPTSLQKGKRNAGLDGAIAELNQHVKKLREKFGHFEYAPFRTPYDKTDSYKPIIIKPSSPAKPFSPVTMKRPPTSVFKRSKLSCKTAAAVRSKYNSIASQKKSETSPIKLSIRLSSSDENSGKQTFEIAGNVKDEVDGIETTEESKSDNVKTSIKEELSSGMSNVKKNFVSMSIIEQVEQKIRGLNEPQVDGQNVVSSSSIKESAEDNLNAGSNDEVSLNEDSGKHNETLTDSNSTDKACKSSEISGNTDDGTNISVDSSTVADASIKAKKHVNSTDNNIEKACDTASSGHSGNDNTETNKKEQHTSSLENVKEVQMESNNQASSKESVLTSGKEKEDSYKEKLKLTIANCKVKVGETEISEEQIDADNYADDPEDRDAESDDEFDLSLVMSGSENSDDDLDEQSEAPSSLMLTETEEESVIDEVDDNETTDKSIMELKKDNKSLDTLKDSNVKEIYSDRDIQDVHGTTEITPENNVLGQTTNTTSTDKKEEISTDNKKIPEGSKTQVDNKTMNVQPTPEDEQSSAVKEFPISKNSVEDNPPNKKAVVEIDRNAVKEIDVSKQTVSNVLQEVEVSKQIVTKASPETDISKDNQENEKGHEAMIVDEECNIAKDSEPSVASKTTPGDITLQDNSGTTQPESVGGQIESNLKEKTNVDGSVVEELENTVENISGQKGKTNIVETNSKGVLENPPEVQKDLSVNQSMMDVSVSEEDSDIERLVIDLDRGKDSPTKFSVKGGEVKNSLGFKHGKSPLIDSTSSKQTEKLPCDKPFVHDKTLSFKKDCVIVSVENENVKTNVTLPLVDSVKTKHTTEKVKAKLVENMKTKQTNVNVEKTGSRVGSDVRSQSKESLNNISENKSSKKRKSKAFQGTSIGSYSEDIIDVSSDSSPVKKSAKTSSSKVTKEGHTEQMRDSTSTVASTGDHLSDSNKDGVTSFGHQTPKDISDRFLKKILNSVQKNFGEMVDEFKHSQNPTDEDLLQESEQVKWNCKNEIIELKQNFQLTVNEMHTSWDAQKEQLIKSLNTKHVQDLEAQKQILQSNLEAAVAEAKKKQWCANCQKEAIFYCCWNTSYCDYPCQQTHWPKHSLTCMQTNKNTDGGDKGTSSSVSHQDITATSAVSSINKTSSQVVTVSSLPKTAVSFRHLPQSLATAIRREEEKRGEARSGMMQKFITGPASVMQNIHQSHLKLTSPSPNMMAPVQGGMFLNQGIPARPPTNQMILQQPMLQQAIYPLQVQRQQPPFSNTVLFPSTNPAQSRVLGYNPGHGF